jgi:hypothetical protein
VITMNFVAFLECCNQRNGAISGGRFSDNKLCHRIARPKTLKRLSRRYFAGFLLFATLRPLRTEHRVYCSRFDALLLGNTTNFRRKIMPKTCRITGGLQLYQGTLECILAVEETLSWLIELMCSTTLTVSPAATNICVVP